MLYSIIISVLSVFFACWSVHCFKMGIQYGREEKLPEIKPSIKTPSTRKKEREAKEQIKKEMERLDVLDRNVANYDGTSNGQVKI